MSCVHVNVTMTLKYSQKNFFRKSRYVWIAWTVLKLFNFLEKDEGGGWTGLRRAEIHERRRRYSFVFISWIKKEFIKIRSRALSRWINCLDRISSIDKAISFNFEFLSFSFHCPTNCSSSGSLIFSTQILNIQWGRRQASSFYHEKHFFWLFSTTTTLLLFFLHHHHQLHISIVHHSPSP